MSYAVCIADLLGPKARAYGCRCECGRCTDAATLPNAKQQRDQKQAAANDREDK